MPSTQTKNLVWIKIENNEMVQECKRTENKQPGYIYHDKQLLNSFQAKVIHYFFKNIDFKTKIKFDKSDSVYIYN